MVSKNFKSFICDEDGQSMVEYGLIIALIALAAVIGLTVFGNSIKEALYDRTIDEIPTV